MDIIRVFAGQSSRGDRGRPRSGARGARGSPGPRALVGDCDRASRQPGAGDAFGREGRRSSGVLGVGRVDHDRALVRASARARPSVGEAARLAGPARDRVSARSAGPQIPDDVASVRWAAELPEPAEGSGARRLLHRLGRDRRDRADLERGRAPLRGGPLRGAAGRPPGRAAGRRRARRGRDLGGAGRPGRAAPRRGAVDRRPQPPVARPDRPGHRRGPDRGDVRGGRMADDHRQVRALAARAVRARGRRGAAPPDRRDAQRGIPAAAAGDGGRAARATSGHRRRQTGPRPADRRARRRGAAARDPRSRRSRPRRSARGVRPGGRRDRSAVGDLRVHDQGVAAGDAGPSGESLGAALERTDGGARPRDRRRPVRSVGALSRGLARGRALLRGGDAAGPGSRRARTPRRRPPPTSGGPTPARPRPSRRSGGSSSTCRATHRTSPHGS